LHDVVVDDAVAPGRDGAHGKFFTPGNADFAHDEDVERRRELDRDLVADRYPTARKRVDDEIRAPGVFAKRRGQNAPSVLSIGVEGHEVFSQVSRAQ
jgi:hypothetical protein